MTLRLAHTLPLPTARTALRRMLKSALLRIRPATPERSKETIVSSPERRASTSTRTLGASRRDDRAEVRACDAARPATSHTNTQNTAATSRGRVGGLVLCFNFVPRDRTAGVACERHAIFVPEGVTGASVRAAGRAGQAGSC